MRSTDSAHLHGWGFEANRRARENYLRRDFAFALAMIANGGPTVIRTSAKIITNPNMI
jgi:hypothetical protein